MGSPVNESVRAATSRFFASSRARLAAQQDEQADDHRQANGDSSQRSAAYCAQEQRLVDQTKHEGDCDGKQRGHESDGEDGENIPSSQIGKASVAHPAIHDDAAGRNNDHVLQSRKKQHGAAEHETPGCDEGQADKPALP